MLTLIMKNTKSALIWITDILKQHQIPFQISGGLAAIAYGATRPFSKICREVVLFFISQRSKNKITFF